MANPTINQQIHQRGSYTALELPAGGTIYPGMLVSQSSTNTFVVFATQGGGTETIIALEDALQGKDVTQPYSVAGTAAFGGGAAVGPDPVQAATELPGNLCMLYCRAGYNYTVGTQLIAFGDGSFYPTTGTPTKVYGTVTIALNLSASSAVASLVQARIR